jgi:D-lactate dehydrogenase (quinone)
MTRTHLPPLEPLRQILGDRLISDAASCWIYGLDNSRLHTLPAAVALPESSQEVAAIMAHCHAHHIAVTVRGRGTATTGAAVPQANGIVISTERMAAIRAIQPENRLLIAQPGITNQVLQQAAAHHGFFWPPDPTSSAVATLGGNLATNAAGPRAVKYGTPRENTLALEAVTASGEIFRCGSATTKGVVGYDLVRLLIGSEGTLAIITEATLKLTPLPDAIATLRACYANVGAAAAAVARIMAQPAIPCALEMMDGKAIAMSRDYAGSDDLPSGTGALLMIEADGSAATLPESVTAITAAAQGDGCLEIRAAHNKAETAALWQRRKALSPALRQIAPKKINEDVVVPVAQIPALIASLEQLAQEFAITIVNFGHAGNGNLHVNLLINPDDAQQANAAALCLDRIFDRVLHLNGTLSGEHGIGSVKRQWVSREIAPVPLALMQGIKQLFDPHHILNPGKALPDPM